MDLSKLSSTKNISKLLKEAFSFSAYKAMPVFARIIVGFFMLPFIVASCALAVVLAIYNFLFTTIQQPVKYVHGILSSEAKGAGSLAQFAIYAIPWLVVFFMYLAFSFMLVYIAILYAILSIFCYVWTLGAFNFHTNLNEEVTGKVAFRVYRIRYIVPIIFAVIACVLYVLFAIEEEAIMIVIALLFTALYSVFVMPLYVKGAMPKKAVEPETVELETVKPETVDADNV